MVFEAAASYVVKEEKLYAVLHLREAFVCYVQQEFPLMLPFSRALLLLLSSTVVIATVGSSQPCELIFSPFDSTFCYAGVYTAVCSGGSSGRHAGRHCHGITHF